jgi:ABC-type branched-subunit amino acid transport system ATPase component
MLSVDRLGVAFGAFTVFEDLTFDVGPGVTALIGPNGAGKSTLVNAITGLLAPKTGSASWNGQNIVGKGIDRVARMGIVRTFQSPRLFASLTVLENVMVGAHGFSRSGMVAAALGLPRSRRSRDDLRDRALQALASVGCDSLADVPAARLTAGQQRLVSVARAIAGGPELLVLDEPAAGLNDHETAVLAADLRRVCDAGTAVLVIEHHMEFVMSLADHVVVLANGRIIADGTAEQVRSDKAVIHAYLGANDA